MNYENIFIVYSNLENYIDYDKIVMHFGVHKITNLAVE